MTSEPDMVDIPPLTEAPSGAGGAQQRMVHIPFPETFVYANCCAFAIGQMEIRLGFAEALQDGTAVPKVGIVLPPEAAAVIALVLFQQVRTFEETFGEIRHQAWKAMKAGLEFKSPYVGPETPSAPETQTQE